MPPFAATALPRLPAEAHLALAGVLAVVGTYLLLPKPKYRSVAGGVGLLLAALAVAGSWLVLAFGHPTTDHVGDALFALFATGAVSFGAVTVTQRNPGRGAIAFAFVVLNVCGLFLLLAAPFLMAATIVIYAGAIIVTFLFVLMLSHVNGPAGENDRTREPLLGSLAGFGFAGLVLFALYQGAGKAAEAAPNVPVPVLSAAEKTALSDVVADLRKAEELLHGDPAGWRKELAKLLDDAEAKLETVVGEADKKPGGRIAYGSVEERLQPLRTDPQSRAVLTRAAAVREKANDTFRSLERKTDPRRPADIAALKAEVRGLREEVSVLYGAGELPARNVANLGYVLYADHLLAVELAGTLLLVATIGAVAIARRKGVAA